jgi:hypothetical protein
MSLLIMLVSAAAIIALVRFGLIVGLENLAGALRWSAKVRGQAPPSHPVPERLDGQPQSV